jgi:hypothetical protein
MAQHHLIDLSKEKPVTWDLSAIKETGKLKGGPLK